MTVRLELDPFADPELEHVHVGMQLMEKSQPLNDPIVEIIQLFLAEFVDVDLHDAVPDW
jgi:hypothetical protein